MKWKNKEFCDECGEPNDMDSEFCLSCGADLTPDQPDQDKKDVFSPAARKQADHSGRLLVWFVIVILIVILVCLKK